MKTPKDKEELFPAVNLRKRRTLWLALVAPLLLASSAVPALAAGGQFVAHNTPPYVSAAKILGSEDPAKTIEVSIWLNVHNPAQLDTLAGELYDPQSPQYRKFLTRAQFAARFAPTAEEAKSVQQFFESHNLKVVKVAPDNFFVRARGTVADVETAFHIQLNNYQVHGKTIRANDRDPYIDGEAAPLVRSVSGLDTGTYDHGAIARPTALPNSKAVALGPKAVSGSSDFYSNICFDGTETETFYPDPEFYSPFPIGTYSGNHLNMPTVTSLGCGYTPPEIQTAYGLTGLYAEGYDGSGQTIGIIDWCGSSTVQSDLNAFSAYFGLPQPALTITYIPTPSQCIDSGDSAEIDIDVEWAHAIAPGAAINLIVPPSASFQDIDQAEYIAIDEDLATVLSGSYGAVELDEPSSELENGNLINEFGAVTGIGVSFSTGDYGDFEAYNAISWNNWGPASVQYPADSPYATAVGGVSLALNSDNSIAWQSGWGNNRPLLAAEGQVYNPSFPTNYFSPNENTNFEFGSGGGPSAFFPKAAYQKKLPGKFRQLPDVSWLADPYTGGVILITVPDEYPPQVWEVYGGTSLACPMFAGLWAIAQQEAGAPLGQAAPYLYSMPAATIRDVLPLSSKNNVIASMQEATGITKFSAPQVAWDTTGVKFISAIWDFAWDEYTAYDMTFGTDSSLTVKKGWDNVTGLGTPNAQAFADYFAPAGNEKNEK
jgi:subtilase family serine protease